MSPSHAHRFPIAIALSVLSTVLLRMNLSASSLADGAGNRETVEWCWTDSAPSAGLISFLQTAVTASGAAAEARRTQLHLPAAQTSDVQLVSDTALCHAAASAHYQRLTGDPNAIPEAVMLVTVGSDRLVLFDGEMPIEGHYLKYYVYDRQYAYLGSWVAR